MLNKCVNGVECSEEAHAKNRRTEFAILNTQTYNEPVNIPSKQNSAIVNSESNIKKNKEQIVAKQLYNSDTESETEAIIGQNMLEEKAVNESINPKIENTYSGLGDDDEMITPNNNKIAKNINNSALEKVDKVSSSDTPENSKKKSSLELIKTNQSV